MFASAEAFQTVVAVAEQRMAQLRSPAWARRVWTALDARPAASCDSDEIAKKLGVSGRSLQRKLAAEGTRFSKVLDESRRDRSIQMIRRPGVTVAAVAAEVGFGDSQAFARAFQRWTGQSPSAYRAGQPPEVADADGDADTSGV